jgi:hypothetical protein
MNNEQLQTTRALSSKWQERFEFFHRIESLDAAGKKSAARSLSFRKSILINFNVIAFFFGFIYFFVLGMWKRNLSMIGITALIYSVILCVAIVGDIEISEGFSRGLGCGISAWYATTANFAYYLKEVKGYNGWNPFKFKA